MTRTLTAQDLVGAWALDAFTIRFDDGRPALEPFGPDASGLLTYTPDGWMSAVLARGDRPPLGVSRLEASARADEAARAAAFDSYLSYAGRWRLEVDAQGDAHVVHEVTLALVPELVGQDNRRAARLLDDGRLELSYHITPRSGVTRRYVLIWRRPDAV